MSHGKWVRTAINSKSVTYSLGPEKPRIKPKPEFTPAPKLPTFVETKNLWSVVDDHYMTHSVNAMNNFLFRHPDFTARKKYDKARSSIAEMVDLGAQDGFLAEEVLGHQERSWAQARGVNLKHQTVLLPVVIRTDALPTVFWFISQAATLPAGSIVEILDANTTAPGARVTVPDWGTVKLWDNGQGMWGGETGELNLPRQIIRVPKLRHYMEVIKMADLTRNHPDTPPKLKLGLPRDIGESYQLHRDYKSLDFTLTSDSVDFTKQHEGMPTSVEKAWVRYMVKDNKASLKKVRKALGQSLRDSRLPAPPD